MDGSPTSQQSQRSRPNYPHPILLEDDRSRNTDATLGSPTSMHVGSIPSDYDPEAPYPHTDNPYAYSHSPSGNNSPDIGAPRIGSHQASPTPIPFPRHYNPGQQRQQHSPTSNTSYASQQSVPIMMRGAQQDYYQGVIPFIGSPPPTQNIPMTPAPSGGYLCEQCSATFTRAHDLRRHYISKHAEVKCQCLCGKNFSRKDALLRHQRPDPVSGYGGCDYAQAVTSPEP